MARRTIGQERFLFVAGGKTSELDALSELINWHEADTLMAPISDAAKGERGWPPLCLLKALLLARWYDLSDVKLTVTVTVVGDDAKISVDHPCAETGATLLLNALGTTNTNFADGLIKQLSCIATDGHNVAIRDINFLVAVIGDIEPRDQMEAMLAAQMAAVHMATMSFAARLTSSDRLYQVGAAQKALNKLARTFTTQMEALNRCRGKGQQKMTVEHVHVHEGGQAIVGNVNKGGGG